MQQDQNIRQLLSAKNLDMPGSNFAKTTIYGLFPLFLLLLLSNTSWHPCDIPGLPAYQDLSFLFLIACLATAIASGCVADHVLDITIGDLGYFVCLYIPKLLISVSVLLFYTVVCAWVVLLGGITCSPFAALLSMSPVLLMIQIWRDRGADLDAYYCVCQKAWQDGQRQGWVLSRWCAKWIVLGLSACPLVLVVGTLILGQVAVVRWEVHRLLLGDAVEKLPTSAWYVSMYYWLYYMSVVIAVFGVAPSAPLRRIWRVLEGFHSSG